MTTSVDPMALSTADCLAAIEKHSALFAEAAHGNLAAAVEHCPGWTVADLVWHLTEVHWFWGTIAHENLASPPDESRSPDRPEEAHLVPTFEQGARRLVEILGAADQTAPCWTWFPPQQDVAFITRHQVQEAAVHTWDAVNAAGGRLEIDPRTATDCVDEFLTTSLADESDAESGTLAPFDGALAFSATDTGEAWTVTDGPVPGSLAMRRGRQDGVPSLDAPAADLLLWIYQRRGLDTGAVPDDLVQRFRTLTSTD
jgi:uncharacterized protein (TIGR03083 family)